MIRTVVFDKPCSVSFKEIKERKLNVNEVRIKTLFSGISHGTEMAFYRGTAPFYEKKFDQATKLFVKSDKSECSYPISYGYANVGKVIEVGKEVSKFSTGDIAFTYSCHTTEVIANEDSVIKLPQSVSPKTGIFVANLRTAYNGILYARINLGETAVVFGLGSIGQMVAQMAKLAGARQVIAVDLIDKRLKLSKKLGADIILNPKECEDVAFEIRKLTRNRGADVVIEVSGSDKALHEAIRSVGVQGNVIAMSFYSGGAKNLFLGEEFHHFGARIQSAQVSYLPPELFTRWTVERRMETILDFLTKLKLKELITHAFDFNDAAKAYEMVDRHPEEIIQVVFKY